MDKPIYKILDDKCRITIPKPIRENLDLASGDIFSVAIDRGRISVRKAIVMQDGTLPMDAKECYVQTVVREMDGQALMELLSLIARLLQEPR